MPERKVVVAALTGLHARPAALLTKAVAASGKTVTIRRNDGRRADARSILAILSLAVKTGDEVVLESADPDTDNLLAEIAELLTSPH